MMLDFGKVMSAICQIYNFTNKFRKFKILFLVQIMPIKAQTLVLDLTYENIIYFILVTFVNKLCWKQYG